MKLFPICHMVNMGEVILPMYSLDWRGFIEFIISRVRCGHFLEHQCVIRYNHRSDEAID